MNQDREKLLPVRLMEGEKVRCLSCKLGFYLPLGDNPHICHCFVCSNCKEKININ